MHVSAFTGLAALGASLVVAALAARLFTTPGKRLTSWAALTGMMALGLPLFRFDYGLADGALYEGIGCLAYLVATYGNLQMPWDLRRAMARDGIHGFRGMPAEAKKFMIRLGVASLVAWVVLGMPSIRG